ncbi:UNC93-like protein MFSD11 isoform X2 [Lineus longissimus]|uniref:UNC93-like protein MFSD11 isoform X2 n=1 Tax=Lineus longissimus TaxID=88925 RepID=UPI00315D0739
MATSVCDVKFVRIVIMSISYMLIFTAFQTSSMLEQSVIDGAKAEPNSTFTGDGFISLATIYAVFAASNWGAPSVISVLGPKISMMVGGVPYLLLVASFLRPMTWALYTGSVLVGLGASVLWTAQGNFLTLNSDTNTITRNSGVFWALMQSNLVIGNLYVYLAFKGDITITSEMRTTLYLILSSICLGGIALLFVLFCLRSPSTESDITPIQGKDSREPLCAEKTGDPAPIEEDDSSGPWQAFKSSLSLLGTKQMLLLTFTFGFTGLHLTFFSGVYGTCVGHTLQLGDNAKSYIGFCGIFIGVGEIVGGLIFSIFGKRTQKYGRDPIILLGFIANIGAYFLIFLNLPDSSPFGNTTDFAHIQSNVGVAVISAFLLGFGDSCFNTQLFSILGDIYREESSQAFALFRFVQSLTAAAGFFYSNHISLQWQLLILVITSVLAIATFIPVEWKNIHPRAGYSNLESEEKS